MEQGRKVIKCDLRPTGDIEKDKKIIPKILEIVMPQHQINCGDIEKLRDYYYNVTDIKNKTTTIRKDINNQIAINYPYIAVTTINAYCFAQPFSFASRNVEKSKEIEEFNKALDDDKYASKMIQTTWHSGVGGLGYKFIAPATEEEARQGKFFHTIGDIDPVTTFCVYANTLQKEKILAVNYFQRNVYDDEYNVKGAETVYNVWTKYHYWIFVNKDGVWKNEKQRALNSEVDAYPINYKIPIIEYPRKQDRTNDFEVAKDLIDAANIIASNRVDNVQQIVDFLLLLRDINTSEEALQDVKDCLKQGIMSFKSIEGATVQPEVKLFQVPLNQTEMQTLQDFLCNKIEEVLCIPNREIRGSSGDTGLAVESRAGYRSLENIAGLITLSAIEAESEALEVILGICAGRSNCPFKDLTVNDIEIKPNRNKVENVTSAANAYSVLRAAGMNDETSCSVTGIVNDPYSVAQKNKKELLETANETQVAKTEPQQNNDTNSASADEV